MTGWQGQGSPGLLARRLSPANPRTAARRGAEVFVEPVAAVSALAGAEAAVATGMPGALE
jgi:hypothetical protein